MKKTLATIIIVTTLSCVTAWAATVNVTQPDANH